MSSENRPEYSLPDEYVIIGLYQHEDQEGEAGGGY